MAWPGCFGAFPSLKKANLLLQFLALLLFGGCFFAGLPLWETLCEEHTDRQAELRGFSLAQVEFFSFLGVAAAFPEIPVGEKAVSASKVIASLQQFDLHGLAKR